MTDETPEGYSAFTPGLLICDKCSAVVHEHEVHGEWHETLKREILMANMGFGGISFG